MARLTALDEQLAHQLPEPLAVVATHHQHWRESYFFVAHPPDDPDGDVVVVALATYPGRGQLDALVLGRVGGQPLAAYHVRPAGDDPHTPVVGPVAVRIEEPLRRVRVTVAESDQVAAEFTFHARTAACPLRRGRLLTDDGEVLWDQSHMFQSATVEGWYRAPAGEGRMDGWVGQRDHSWGIRQHGRIPLWMWLAVQLPDGMLGVWHWETPEGAVVFSDGCFAPTGGGPPVPLVGFSHDLGWTDEAGDPVGYGPDGAAVAGLAGSVRFALAGGRAVTVRGSGRWCAPYRPLYGGGQHLLGVETDDGRRGTAVVEVTGRDHHHFFPEPLPVH